jgi:murein DD-endopeptidase MepM/ murein hydrolase activator NlpD
MTGRGRSLSWRLFGAAAACALAASAGAAHALPKPKYPVEKSEKSRHGKADSNGERADKTYTVARGDTLAGLAHRFGVSQKDLAEANDLHGKSLRPGMKLHVPGEPERRADRAEDKPRGKGGGDRGGTYTVARGDTLHSIAHKLGVSEKELAAANDGGHGLRPGMKLHVPGGSSEARDDEAPRARKGGKAAAETYTVARGDTLAGIARKLGVSERELADANDIHGGRVRAGMKLHVPGEGRTEAREDTPRGRRGETESAGGGTYTVARGDTLSGVSRRFGVTTRELRAANDLLPDEPLDKGMKLRLPASARDRGHDAHASGAFSGARTQVASSRPSYPERTRVAEPPPSPQPSAADVPVIVAPPPAPERVADATPPAADHPAYARPPAADHPAYTPPPAAYARPAPDHAAYTPGVTLKPAQPVTGSAISNTPVIGTQPGSLRAANDHASVGPIHPTTAKDYPSPDEIAALGKGRFIWPVKGDVVTRFGDMGHGLGNDGMNIGALLGTGVRSAADGQVVYAGDEVPGLGNMILVKHSDGWLTAYGHLSKIDVKMGQKVFQGEQIGEVGQSGGIATPQLHFEVRYAPNPSVKARPVDPSRLLP